MIAMNTNFENMPPDDLRFDRLVDGELSETQRRELLAGLDHEPGGWRRCALAFIEAQCWRQEFGAIANNATPTATTPRVSVVRRAHWLGRVGAPLAIAASLLVAVWAGTLLQQARNVGPAGPAGSGMIGNVADNSANRQLVAMPNVAAPTPFPAGPWQIVNVSSPAGTKDANMSFELPAVESNNLDPQWLQNMPSAIPDNVMQAFNRSGHNVQQHRELVPVRLNDGRRMIVPVDNVDIHYTGNKSY
jgi:hypothetical protein